jgi:hypothetical protein
MKKFDIDKKDLKTNKEKIQSFMNFLSNKNVSTTGYTIEYIKDAIDILRNDDKISQDEIIKTYLKKKTT